MGTTGQRFRISTAFVLITGLCSAPFSFVFGYSAAGAGNQQDHFSQGTCNGCHAGGTNLTNFTTIQSGPANMLLPNTVYQIRINAISMIGGRDAFKVQIANTTTGTSLGTLLDGPAGNPIPDSSSNARRKAGSKIADTNNGTETFRDYYWRSPAGPNELPASVTITGYFLDGAGNANGGEPQGIQQITLSNPNFNPDNGNDEEDETDDQTTGGSAGTNGQYGSGFSDISSGCGVLNSNSGDRSAPGLALIAFLFVFALGSLARTRYAKRDADHLRN